MAAAVPTLLGKNSPAGSATSVAVVLTRDQDAGTILVVVAGVAALSGTASATCADNRSVGNSYNADCIANNSNRPLAVFSSKPGTLVKTGDTVTVSSLVSGSSRFIAVYQVTNLDQTTWLNATAGNPKTANATSASPNSGTLTLAAGSYWLFGALASANASAATAGGDNQSGTYAILDQGGNIAAEHENVTPGSSLAYQAAFAQTSTASCTAMVVYNIASGVSNVTLSIPAAAATAAANVPAVQLSAPAPAAAATAAANVPGVKVTVSPAAAAASAAASVPGVALTISPAAAAASASAAVPGVRLGLAIPAAAATALAPVPTVTISGSTTAVPMRMLMGVGQ